MKKLSLKTKQKMLKVALLVIGLSVGFLLLIKPASTQAIDRKRADINHDGVVDLSDYNILMSKLKL